MNLLVDIHVPMRLKILVILLILAVAYKYASVPPTTSGVNNKQWPASTNEVDKTKEVGKGKEAVKEPAATNAAQNPTPVMILVGTRDHYFLRVWDALILANRHSPHGAVYLVGENATRFRGLVGARVHDILLNGYPSTLTGPTRLKHLWYAAMHFVWGSLA